jgi:hypothetical protein
LFVDLPANQVFTLRVAANGYLPLELSGVTPRGGELELTMHPNTSARALIRGRLLRPDGSGAKGTTVEVRRRDPQQMLRATIESDDGSFAIEVGRGSWALRVETSEHPHVYAGRHDLEPGAVWEVGTLSLTRGGTVLVRAPADSKLSYRILDHAETYVSGLFSPVPPQRSRLLKPGRYLLVVSGPGVAAQIIPFTIDSDTETPIDVQLPPGVRQRLVFEAGKATGLPYSVPFTVRQGDRLVLHESMRKPVQGQYTLDVWLAPGDYVLTTRHEELHGEVAFRIGEREGLEKRVRLR